MRARDARVGVRADDRARAGAQRGDVPDAQRPAHGAAARRRAGARLPRLSRRRPPTPRRPRASPRRCACSRARSCARARCSPCWTTPPPCARSRPTSARCRGCRPPSASPRRATDEARPVDFVARYFAPTFGVNEDPVTGSAYCTLAPYWARAARQAGAARASGEPPRRRAVLRARRRPRAHRRQGAPGHHGYADVLTGLRERRWTTSTARSAASAGARCAS